jgi:hypothetical protein
MKILTLLYLANVIAIAYGGNPGRDSQSIPKNIPLVKSKVLAPKKSKIVTAGWCPQSTWFGFTGVPTWKADDDLPICGNVKSTCCSDENLEQYQSRFKTWVRQLSAVMWSISKLPNINGILFNGMNDRMKAGGGHATISAQKKRL